VVRAGLNGGAEFDALEIVSAGDITRKTQLFSSARIMSRIVAGDRQSGMVAKFVEKLIAPALSVQSAGTRRGCRSLGGTSLQAYIGD
jgi:hypothetical protein